VAGCCECGDEPSGSCATELVSFRIYSPVSFLQKQQFNVQDIVNCSLTLAIRWNGLK
jgi:hypothetical protein